MVGQNKNVYFKVTVNGEQIAEKSRKTVDHGVNLLLTAAEEKGIDWTSHDLLITVIPKVLSAIDIVQQHYRRTFQKG